MIQNNYFEQFEELYSRWSVLDKVAKEMQIAKMWQQLSATYNYICQLYQSRGYLTVAESNYASQIYQMLVGLNTQKMKVDQELTDEMIKHLIKMKAKQI
jgi:hypothetical protein